VLDDDDVKHYEEDYAQEYTVPLIFNVFEASMALPYSFWATNSVQDLLIMRAPVPSAGGDLGYAQRSLLE